MLLKINNKKYIYIFNIKVGGIMPGLEVKLIDVPEMDYLTNQKDEKGNLIVRGEVLLRGP